MKKILSIIMTVVLLLSVIGITPAVSAQETEYTLVDKELAKVYWEEISDDRSIYVSGDWYYTCVGGITYPGAVIGVCGYKGKETSITIPTRFLGKNVTYMSNFYIFSNTVKTINIPKEITSINLMFEDASYGDEERYEHNKKYKPIIECNDSPLEEIIVDSENPKYTSKDGVLFTKNMGKVLYYPPYKHDEKYIIPETVVQIERAAFAEIKNLKSLTITPNVRKLGYGCIPKKGLDELYYINTILPQYRYFVADPADDVEPGVDYLPDIPNTVVYCIEGTDLYNIYKESLEEPEGECKELKGLKLNETLIKESGKWHYYLNGYKRYASTLVKYKGVWFYVSNGIWNKNLNDIRCYYKGKCFYINNGKWNKKVNGFIKMEAKNTLRNEWHYFANGKLYDRTHDLVKCNGKWFYIVDGIWYAGRDGYVYTESGNMIWYSNTIFKKNGKWFAIKKGKWYKDKAIIEYLGKKYYVNKGFVRFDYSGKVKVDGKTYKIKNGKVV